GRNTIALGGEPFLPKCESSLPVLGSQRRRGASNPASRDAKALPSAVNVRAALLDRVPTPSQRRSSLPLVQSQNRIVRSRPPETTVLPSGAKTTAFATPLWPSAGRRSSQEFTSHMRMRRFISPETRVLLSGLNARAV